MFSLATWYVFLKKEQKDKAEYVLLFFCLKNVMKKYVFLFRKLRETLCSPYRTCQNDIKHRNKMKYTVLFLDIFLDIC